MGRRRSRDTHVDFARARLTQHRNYFAQRSATHQRVLNEHDALTAQQVNDWIELYLYTEMTYRLARLNESAANIMASHQPHLERQPRLLSVAECGGVA